MDKKIREAVETGMAYLQTVSDNLTYSKSFISPIVIASFTQKEKMALIGEAMIAQTLSGEIQKMLNDEYKKLDEEMCKYLDMSEKGESDKEENAARARELYVKSEELKDQIKEFRRLDAFIDGKSYDLAIACDIPQIFSTTGLFYNEDFKNPKGFSQLRDITERFEKKIEEGKTQPVDKFYANFMKPRIIKFATEWESYRNYDLGPITQAERDRLFDLSQRFLKAANELNEKYKDFHLEPDGTVKSKTEKEHSLFTKKKNIDEKTEVGQIKGYERQDYLYLYITNEISQYLSTGETALLKKEALFDLARHKNETTETLKDGSTIKREGVKEFGRLSGAVSLENKRDPSIPDTIGLAEHFSRKAKAEASLSVANIEGKRTKDDKKTGIKTEYYAKEKVGTAEASVEFAKSGLSASASAAVTDAAIGKTVEEENGNKAGIEIDAGIKAKASVSYDLNSIVFGEKPFDASAKAGPSVAIKETINDQTILKIGADGGIPKIKSPALLDKSSNEDSKSFIKNITEGLKNLFKIRKSLEINEESGALAKVEDIAAKNNLSIEEIKKLEGKELYTSIASFMESVSELSKNIDEREELLSQLGGFTRKEQSAICRGLKGDNPLTVQEILERVNRNPEKMYMIEDKEEGKTIAANKDWVVVIDGKIPEEIKTF